MEEVLLRFFSPVSAQVMSEMTRNSAMGAAIK
jgi:hypothetical protein